MNVELLLKVKEAILEEPRRIDMSCWGSTWTPREAASSGGAIPPCGTVGCIAGWAATIAWKEKRHLKTNSGAMISVQRNVGDLSFAGQEALGLSREVDADELFIDGNWPVDLRDRLEAEDAGTPAYAAVVAEAIDRFIACDGDWSAEKAVAS